MSIISHKKSSVHGQESLKIVAVSQWWIGLEYFNFLSKQQSHFFVYVI
jgi:hypothetical protein